MQIYQPNSGSTVFMPAFYSGLGAGVLKSTDYGQTWTRVGVALNVVVVFGTPRLRDVRMGVWRLRTRSSPSVCATARTIWMGAHVNAARDGDWPRAGSDGFRRHQLRYFDGQLARRPLAPCRMSAPPPIIPSTRIYLRFQWTGPSGPGGADGNVRISWRFPNVWNATRPESGTLLGNEKCTVSATTNR